MINDTTYPMSHQHLRAMGLRAQLLAVDAQSAALRAMDREHSFGTESSFDIEVIRKDVHDFVRDVFACANDSADQTPEQVKAQLATLVARARELKKQTDLLNRKGESRAKVRFCHAIDTQAPAEADAPPGKSASEAEGGYLSKPASDPVELQDKADFACLRAEVDEYASLAMQVHALCNLALEYCFTSAVKCSHSSGNI